VELKIAVLKTDHPLYEQVALAYEKLVIGKMKTLSYTYIQRFQMLNADVLHANRRFQRQFMSKIPPR